MKRPLTYGAMWPADLWGDGARSPMGRCGPLTYEAMWPADLWGDVARSPYCVWVAKFKNQIRLCKEAF